MSKFSKVHFNFNSFLASIAIVSFLVIIFLVFTTSTNAATGINRQINFQGKLVNNPAATNVTDTTYTVVFTLYNNPNVGQGTALWTETNTNVTTVDGIFRVALGSVNPIPSNFNFNWDGLYLGIKVGADDEMTPRIQMAAVPFAFNAEKVAGLTVQDTSGNASTSGTLQVANGVTVKLPVSGTGLIYADSASTGTLATISNSTTQTGNVIGQAITLSGATGSLNQTGLQFNLSGATSGTVLDIQGTSNSWYITRAGALTVASCSGCGGVGSTNYWGLTSGGTTGGLLYNGNQTTDFAIAGTSTSSALFSFSGVLTGNTIASVSGNLIVMANNGWGGQVGIGTTTPNQALDVRGSSIFGNQLAYDVTAQPNRSKIIYANELTTNTTNDMFSTAGSLEVNPAGATSRIYYGGLYNVLSTSGNAQNFTGRLVGFQGQVNHKGTGTLAQARGFAGLIINDSTGTITNAFAGRFGNTNSSTGSFTNAYGVIILSPTNSGGGTYNTNYGLYVQDQSNVGVVGSYNIWSDGFNSKNYFAGSVGIGATPSARLHVAGSWGSNATVIIDQLNSGDILAASVSGTTKFRVANNGDLILSAGINLGGTNGTSSDCLKGGATAAWGSCGTGSSSSGPFAEISASGVIVPNNSTVDFLIGGQSTASALFAITGVAAGTPVATLSASTNGNGLVLSGSTSTIQSLKNNALVLGGNTTGDIQFKPGTGMVFIGENEVKSGGLTFYSSGAGETDPSITTDANGNLIFSAPTGTIELGSGTGNVSLEGDADTSIIASYIGIPAADMFQITNSGQAVTATGVDGLAITYVLGGAGAVTNAGLTVDLTTTNNNASTVLRGINIGNITGQASATEVGLRIGTGWDTGISVESGGITIAAGALAVNSDSITADGATLTINAGGAVDIQDGLTVDSLTIDTADITWSGTTPTITINAAETFTISNGTAADNFIYNTSTNALTLGDGTNGLTFDIDTGMTYQGSGRPTKKITLNAEYPGAILTASGSGTTTGSMTSDASPSAELSNWRTYYEWSSSTASPLQDYTVVVRVKLPEDFGAWSLTNALTISYNTELPGSGSNKMDVIIYNADTSLSTADQSTPVVMRTANISASAKTWLNLSIDDSDLIDNGNALDVAGDTAVIYLKMYSMDNNHVQIGDITLSYLSKF